MGGRYIQQVQTKHTGFYKLRGKGVGAAGGGRDERREKGRVQQGAGKDHKRALGIE